MSILPPVLPEPGGAVTGSIGPAAPTIRLGARVVAVAGADALIESRHGRALLQGGPALRSGTVLTLELQRAETAATRGGRLVAIGPQRLEPAVPVRLQPVSPPSPVATVRTVATTEVSLHALGPDHQPTTPAFPARLAVAAPPLGPVSRGSSVTETASSGGAGARGSAQPGTSSPTDRALPAKIAGAPVLSRPAVPPTGPGPVVAIPGANPSIAPNVIAGQPGALAAHGDAIEAIVLPRDALGRTVLRAAGVTFQIDTPVDLPVAARVQLVLPAAPAPSSAAPIRAGPLEAARTLAISLSDGMEKPTAAGTLRLPEPTATLAARVLRLVRLIAPPSRVVPGPAEPAIAERQLVGEPVATALAELGPTRRRASERRLACAPAAAGLRGHTAAPAVCARGRLRGGRRRGPRFGWRERLPAGGVRA